MRGLCPGLPPLDLLVVPAENLVHRVLVCADLVALVEEEDVALGVLRMRIHHKVTKIREDAQRCDAHRLVGAKMRCKQTCWRKDASRLVERMPSNLRRWHQHCFVMERPWNTRMPYVCVILYV